MDVPKKSQGYCLFLWNPNLPICSQKLTHPQLLSQDTGIKSNRSEVRHADGHGVGVYGVKHSSAGQRMMMMMVVMMMVLMMMVVMMVVVVVVMMMMVMMVIAWNLGLGTPHKSDRGYYQTFEWVTIRHGSHLAKFCENLITLWSKSVNKTLS